MNMWTEFIWITMQSNSGRCVHGRGLLRSVKAEEFSPAEILTINEDIFQEIVRFCIVVTATSSLVLFGTDKFQYFGPNY